ncbi:MAG: HlyD family secretion protein, partial [Verrucomicrobiales bacterium]
MPKKLSKYFLTGLLVAIAVALVLIKHRSSVEKPWTRDGQVRANVIQIAPRVSAPITNLPIRDNQFVKAGDLLFEVDPRTFQANLDQARAQLDATGDSVKVLEKQVLAAEAGLKASEASIKQAQSSIAQLDATISKNKAEYERQKIMLPKKATSQRSVERAEASYEESVQQQNGARAGLLQAEAAKAQSQASLEEAQAQLGAIGDSNSQVRAALAAVRQAELDLEFTRMIAPVDGYITNLNLRLGSQAVANQPALALVDVDSFWIDAYFKENTIEDMGAGDRAIVTLMSYPDKPIEATVDSLGWGIAQDDGSTGDDLLPNISPTFEWIRLAQRVPVRIHLGELPEGVA